ncbi:hypothetical protein SCHPADRAFT_840306 [Schizopora paradoxa]|uniref:Integrase catalytic domain-containing protein n=1 Tax=Schizopora paradoxa TaxID=27342 RepID=A0A0H2QYT8_9AGAM|nr:hypothetical protein SCHPADRAFT_840306 [Schizopora paradoxa]
MNRYGIPQVAISAYNSKANGVVERGHFIIREAIVKACNGKVSQWPDKVQIAFFADRVTITRSTGFSPFYLLHGIDPILPFDLVEATCLVEGFYDGMPSADLLALRIRQLEKRDEDMAEAAECLARTRFKSKQKFEQKFRKRISNHIFSEGDLVLVRNTAIEKELNRKTKPRYLGPYVIVRRTKGGSYIVRELNGAPSRRGIAAFRIIPYISRSLDLSEISVPPNYPPGSSESSESADDSDSSKSNNTNTDSD